MPRAYLLAVTVGSSLDQGTNNVTLFQLVEQVNVPAGSTPPLGTQLPLEIHCYFFVDGSELGKQVDARFALVGPLGLETFSEAATQRVVTGRYRTRTLGLAVPPSLGHYELRVDFRIEGSDAWSRDPVAYPISFVEVPTKPPMTH